MMLQTYNIFFIFSIIFPTFALSGRIKQQEGTKMKQIIIADNQDITRAGLLHVLSRMGEVSCQVAAGKSELMHRLKACPEAVVILDYTLFDFSGAADLLVLGQRYPLAHLVLWSEELSVGFIRSVVSASGLVSVLMKDAKLPEIEQCLDYVLHGRRFLCQHAAGLLLNGGGRSGLPLVLLQAGKRVVSPFSQKDFPCDGRTLTAAPRWRGACVLSL